MPDNQNVASLDLTTTEKTEVFSEVEKYIRQQRLTIVTKDASRPWGGFFVLDEKQAELFAAKFFPDIKSSELYLGGKLSPKFLLVQPGKRLSWQYHHRRAELWRVVYGKVGVATSDTDKEGKVKEHNRGDLIRLSKGQRHRLVGLSSWGVVAEIWQHTDPANPSDESDIVRLQDDFGR